jgi:peptidoglycan/xylan/chitin deacetylase (PgdA/CDA1 family)
LSLDFELIWGTADLFGEEGFRRAVEVERREVVPQLLSLLREYEISATWCVLGHLLLDRCGARDGRIHPEIVRPAHAWVKSDWFAHDPGGTEASAPLHLGRSLVQMIRECPVPQEIGCHSFSHVIFGDPGCSQATAESELAACVAAAKEMGIEMRAFAFPADVIWAADPPTVLPDEEQPGLWNLPGSMIYFPMHGVRRWVPMARRVKRATRGLDAAALERRIFHLWFHPTNLADSREAMFGGLREIFRHAANLRERGVLDIKPMGRVVEKGTPA